MDESVCSNCIEYQPNWHCMKQRPTNGDVIRQGGDKALAEISVYKKQLAGCIEVYCSTLIKEKYWVSRQSAIQCAEQTLNAPAENNTESED